MDDRPANPSLWTTPADPADPRRELGALGIREFVNTQLVHEPGAR